MPLPNGIIGPYRISNPLIYSPFVQSWSDSNVNPPPPGASLMITQIGDLMLTESGDYMIIEG